MYNSDTDLMFPPRVIPQLKGLRGEIWKKLVEEIDMPETSLVRKAAFTLMMVRLGGCQGCSVDSFRGMRGCTICAKQTIRRFRGADQDLVNQYQQAQSEVEKYLENY